MRSILLFFLLLFSGIVKAQTPTWNWAIGASDAYGAVGTTGTGTDIAGNVYVSGFVSSSQANNNSFGYTYLGYGCLFILKHNPQGTRLWAKVFPKALGLSGLVDTEGNIYATGFFYDTLNIGSYSLVAEGHRDMFIAKFDSAGSVLWARKAGAEGYPPNWPDLILREDQSDEIAVDAAGNSYVGGTIMCSETVPAMFDGLAVYAPAGITNMAHFAFVAKYDAQGQIQWVRLLNGPIKGLDVTPQGDCFITGNISGTINFIGSSATLTSAGPYDIYYACYDTSGTLKWAKSIGGPHTDYPGDIAVNAQGECFVTGTFKGNAQFGPYTLSSSPDQGMLFLIRADVNGDIVWAKQTTGTGDSFLGDLLLLLDADDNCYVAGSMQGSIQVGAQTLFSGNNYLPVVTKWSHSGTPLWAVKVNGSNSASPRSIALDRTFSNFYVSGSKYAGPLQFGPHAVSGSNVFIAELGNIITAAPEATAAASLTLYPNPSHNRRLLVELPEEATAATFVLTDVRGQTVHTGTFLRSGTTELGLPQLPAGTYILTVQTAAQVWRQKVVLQ